MGAQAVRLSNVDIDNALKNKDFEVLFQPVFDLGNGALARVETFVRWRHPKLGLLPPGAFISFFESQGRMSELTRYVLASSLKSYMDWRGPWPPGLSVNLALSDLSDDAFTSHFTKLLRDYEFPADLVTLECPMPPVDMSMETAQGHFQRLAETGARLAIEVRGRANELLRSLDPFPFDEIKTGGSAILRFARTVRGPGLSAIADLLDVANNANAAITAVGVEDQASLAALRGLGFTAAQGNHLAKVGAITDFRPQRINEVRALLDLEPLSQENLTALFRTEAPATQAAPSAQTDDEKDAAEDALLDRMSKRVAQFDTPVKTASVKQAPAAKTEETAVDDEKKAKAREKAKALALVKRQKARAARKTAAIERAKAKAAAKPVGEHAEIPTDMQGPAPHDMQERLSRAFNTEQDAEAASPGASRPPASPHEAEPISVEGAPVMTGPEEIETAAQTPFEEQKTAAQAGQAAKPSIIERAMAQQQEGAQQQARAQQQAGGRRAAQQGARAQTQASASALTERLSLAVGASGAYFQPGIRVGAPALPGTPEKPVTPSGLKLPKPAEETPPTALTPEPESTSAGDAGASPPAPAGDAPLAAQPAKREHLGDLHADQNDAAPQRRARRRKPFLKRTVIPLSGHFWPKSWRRAWERRAADERNEDIAQQAAD